MKLLTCPATGVVEVTDVPVPTLGPGDILLRMQACGICGTDVMKVYDPGVTKPVQLGHEIAGVIEAVGEGVAGFEIGHRVAVAHHAPDYASHYTLRGSPTQDPHFKASNVVPGGFAEWIRVPADLVPHTVKAVPDHVPTLRAAFMEPLACCIRAARSVAVAKGDTVLIVGVGSIGLIFVPLLRHLGLSVIAADVKRDRLEAASNWGASHAFLTGEESSVTHRITEGRGVDAVILTVTNPATLDLALSSVRDGGTIMPFGVKPGMRADFDFWQLYRREISVVTSYSAAPEDLTQAMALLSGPGFELESIISRTLPLSQAAQGFSDLHAIRASKIVITA